MRSHIRCHGNVKECAETVCVVIIDSDTYMLKNILSDMKEALVQ